MPPMNKFPNNQKLLLFGIIAPLLFIGLSVYYIVAPNIAWLNINNAKINSGLSEFINNAEAKQEIAKIISGLKESRPKVTAIDAMFFNNDNFQIFSKEITDIARRNNLTLDLNLSENPATSSTGYLIAPLSIETKGGFPEQLKFLGTLTSLKYHTDIKNINITSAGEKVKMNLIINTYWH